MLTPIVTRSLPLSVLTTSTSSQAVRYRLERTFDCRAQAVGTELGRLAHDAVYENRRSKFDAVHVAVFDVAPDFRVVLAAGKLCVEPFAIESQLGRIFFQ